MQKMGMMSSMEIEYFFPMKISGKEMIMRPKVKKTYTMFGLITLLMTLKSSSLIPRAIGNMTSKIRPIRTQW